jgi:hypothetical protein
MASKKTKKSIQVKLNVKKPIKVAKKAAEEAARIRKNEQNRLYRLNKKFKGVKRKGEADKLRREIRTLEKDLRGISTVVSDIRAKAKKIDAEKKEIKSLKLQNAAITRKLNKKFESGKKGFDAEYTALSKQHIKNTGLIQQRMQKAAALTYEINKNLGFDPKDIAKNIEISNNTLADEFSDDFEESYFSGAGGGKRRGPGGEEYEEEIIEEDSGELEEPDQYGWQEIDSSTFFTMWKDFDNVEKRNLHSYEQVVFQFEGGTHRYKGTSDTLIIMRASEMWRYCRVNGSDTIVTKYKTLDETKLKYVVE